MSSGAVGLGRQRLRYRQLVNSRLCDGTKFLSFFVSSVPLQMLELCFLRGGVRISVVYVFFCSELILLVYGFQFCRPPEATNGT